MPYCPHCQNSYETESEFCPHCGARTPIRNIAPVEEVTMFTAWQKYSQFTGRARRKEYWLWTLFTSLVSMACSLVGTMFCFVDPDVGNAISSGLSFLTGVAFFLPGLAVFVRRMHDTGRSGWNWFWVLLPCIGWIVLLVYCCEDSQPGDNQYGPNPKNC